MRPKVTDTKELDSVVDAALARPRRRTTLQVAPGPEVEEAAPARPVETPCEPVSFVCNAVPALGIGLGGRLHYFQNGMLTLDTAEAIAAIRAHPLFGRQLFEYVEVDMSNLSDELRETLEGPPESQSPFLRPGERPRTSSRPIRLMPTGRDVRAPSGEAGQRAPGRVEQPPRRGHHATGGGTAKEILRGNERGEGW